MKRNIRYIYIGHVISLIIIIVIALLFYRQFQDLIKNTGQSNRIHLVQNKLRDVQVNLLELQVYQRDYIITGNDKLLDSSVLWQIRLNSDLNSLDSLVTLNHQHREIVIKLRDNISRSSIIFHKIFNDQVVGKNRDISVYAAEGKTLIADFKMLAAKIDRDEQLLLEDRRRINEDYRVISLLLKLIFLFSASFQVTSFFFIINEFKKRHRYQQDLETKVKELNTTNTELEQIAFVASHDLQEPLRKIRTFSNRLADKHKNALNDEGRVLIDKLNTAALRMQGLIEDLLQYNTIIKSDEAKTSVDLDKIVKDVTKLLALKIHEKKASVTIDDLPVITGFPHQVELLVFSLLDNALKFTQPGVLPIIKIGATTVDGKHTGLADAKDQPYIQLSISDNGIGFDEAFAHKIFVIFQRLHTQNSEFDGKGIGLAICKRIMINHDGLIEALGKPGNGTTIKCYFLQV